MVEITIDGTKVTVENDITILKAAKGLDIDIPTFCYQEKLNPIAACRICLIEIEGQKKLQPSCATLVMDGMVVYTRSERVEEARKGMLEIILANHPLDCPTCDKGGECELQDMVFTYGVKEGRFEETKRVFHSKDYVMSPAIIKNSNRCIHCERCVRVCDEVVGAGVLGIHWRGAATEETSFMRGTLQCDHCGNCIDVCPVGSLMSLPYRYKARPWDLEKIDTTCPYCSTGCSLTASLRDGSLVRVVANKEVGVNDEYLCPKGRFGIDLATSDNRIKRPLIRKNDILVAASWQETLQFLSGTLKDILSDNDLEVGGVASARLSNEELYSFQKIMRTAFKTNNIDSSVSIGGGDAYEVLGEILTKWSLSSSLEKALEADTVFLFGAKTDDENPVTDYIIRRTLSQKAINLMIAHPQPLRLDELASKAVKYIPGTESYFLEALLKKLLNISSDKKESKGKIPNEAELVKNLESNKSQYSQLSDTLESDVKDLAQGLYDAEKISFIVGIDFFKALGTDAAIKNLANVSILLEALNKEIVTIHPLFDKGNQRGAWDMGALPTYLPGYKRVDDGEAKKQFENEWGEALPSREGKDIHGMFELATEGKLGALYIVGDDPLGSYPDRGLAEEALGKTKLLIVQDSIMTETAKVAHIVLPSASLMENDGTYTNSEGRVQRLRKVFNPPFEVESNLTIFNQVFSVLQAKEISHSPKETFEEIVKLIPSYSGISYQGIDKDASFCCSDVTKKLDSFYLPDKLPSLNGLTKDYPFYLHSGNHLYHSEVITQEVAFLNELLNEPYVEINSKDASSLGLNAGDMVRVAGENGGEAIHTLKVNPLFPEKVAFIPDNFKESRVNKLMSGGETLNRVKISKV